METEDWTGASPPRTPGTEAAPEAWTDPPSEPPGGAKPADAPDFPRLRAGPLLSPDTRVSLVCPLPTPCGRTPSPTAQTPVAPALLSAGTRSVFWKQGGAGGGCWCCGGSTGGGAGLTCLGCRLRGLGTPRPWPSPLASKPGVPHLSDADNRREK